MSRSTPNRQGTLSVSSSHSSSLLRLLFFLAFITISTALPASTSTTSTNNNNIPQPFDTTLNYNLTSSCLSFFQTFTKDQNFQKCYSFGFLLLNSNNFAVQSRNVSSVPALLDQICNAPNSSDECNKIMSTYASQIVSSSNCRTDLQSQNPIATEAFVSFNTYQLYQLAGCSKNSSNVYCYVDALAQKLGLGIFYLPSGTQLTAPQEQLPCSECNQKILNIYSEYAGDSSLPLSQTFSPVRTYFNDFCGPNFVNEASTVHSASAVSITSDASSLFSRGVIKRSRYTNHIIPGISMLTTMMTSLFGLYLQITKS
ncbi:8758_t:CDS:2 [Ambispora leptoticha]|uniref:8758_t:CDS:1 n=1 Tax=Ambispora leptoticha TaxID=144679 RepID=A0A9N9BYJ1_9GLOM|nr:8758_t:CDS:2 [Ambispora leptoticha]